MEEISVRRPQGAREALLQSAVELFRARGYEGVGVAELLEKSGAPRGSLYFHFPGGKEQIGAEAVATDGAIVAGQFKALRESGVDLDTFIVRVFKATAKKVQDAAFRGSCPIAAIAAEMSNDSPMLMEAVRKAWGMWEHEFALTAEARGHSKENAKVFASAMLSAVEGAILVSKAQQSTKPHTAAAQAMRALAAALQPHSKS